MKVPDCGYTDQVGYALLAWQKLLPAKETEPTWMDVGGSAAA
jgi:hypothetical protein